MRILRVRRGFTTNSSSASEWLDTASTAWGGVDGEKNFTYSGESSSPKPAEPATSNSIILIIVVGAVATLFGIERAIRKLFGKSRKGESNE
jgi:hypothetical protein